MYNDSIHHHDSYKNEEHNIVRTLKPLGDLTDDLLVVDSGSADHTISLAQQAGARVIQTTWQGYANTKTGHIHKHLMIGFAASMQMKK